MDQLKKFASGHGPAANFARSTYHIGSTTLDFPVSEETEEKRSVHSPDMSFIQIGAKWPGVVIELSYSTKKKDIRRLVSDYIVESDANINMVVVLDIEYQGARSASFSVWRPQFSISQGDGQEELTAAQIEADVVRQLIFPLLN